MKSKFFSDKQFFRTVFLIALPILVQNTITNFVNLLDNIMVGRIGTASMTGVSIVNQLMVIFNLTIFGCISGAGIFTTQFFGKGDQKGIADTARFKLYAGTLFTVIGILVFLFFGEPLIQMYLRGEGAIEDAQASLSVGLDYLHIILLGLFPFSIVQCYAGTLRETGETYKPMVAGIAAVIVNLCGNYILIFGKLGLPAFGAAGAAIATVISRYVELLIVVIWVHADKQKHPFAKMIYSTPNVPKKLIGSILIKGTPILFNESFFAISLALLTQCYSVRGLSVVSATNISSVISNLFKVISISLGTTVSIMIGRLLGAGQYEEAVEKDRKLIIFSTAVCLFFGGVLFLIAPYFPRIYNTSDEIRSLATNLIYILAIYLPFGGFLDSVYFTLRSGGNTLITLLFDSVFLCFISLPAAYILVHFTSLPIVPVYAIIQCLDLLKCLIGYILVKKRVWVHNIVENHN